MERYEVIAANSLGTGACVARALVRSLRAVPNCVSLPRLVRRDCSWLAADPRGSCCSVSRARCTLPVLVRILLLMARRRDETFLCTYRGEMRGRVRARSDCGDRRSDAPG